MNQKAEFNMNGNLYTLITDYRDDAYYRNSLNRLTQKIYGFDFEAWYQNGYWQDKYIPYTLLYKNEVIANVSVSIMEFLIHGRRIRPIQIGTVMTEKSHRHQGLIRILMNSVMEDFQGNCDFIYLFANESVLDFYPKFGFVKIPEYECSKTYHKNKAAYGHRKINMENKQDAALLLRLIHNSHPIAKVSMVNNTDLVMFYCLSFMKDNIYYIEDLDAAVLAEFNKNQLMIQDVFCEKPVDLDRIINTLMTSDTMIVYPGFTPIDDNSYIKGVLQETDTTLFIKGRNPLEDVMFPVLSHA